MGLAYHRSCSVNSGPANAEEAFRQLSTRLGDNEVVVLDKPTVTMGAFGSTYRMSIKEASGQMSDTTKLEIEQQNTPWGRSILVYNIEEFGRKTPTLGFHHMQVEGRDIYWFDVYSYGFNGSQLQLQGRAVELSTRMYDSIQSLDGNENVFSYAVLFDLPVNCVFPQH